MKYVAGKQKANKAARRRRALKLPEAVPDEVVMETWDATLRELRPKHSLPVLSKMLGMALHTLHRECRLLGIQGSRDQVTLRAERPTKPRYRRNDPSRLKQCVECGVPRPAHRLSKGHGKIRAGLCPTCHNVSRIKTLGRGDACAAVGRELKLLTLSKIRGICAKHDCPGCPIRSKVLQEGFIPSNVKQLKLRSQPL